MAKRPSLDDEYPQRSRPPGKTPEDRENQLIAAAVELAERQIIEGTASAQVITHYLKLGSSREKLEQRRIEQEVLKLQKQQEIMESAQRVEEMYSEAMDAFRAYSGRPSEDDDEDD